MENLQQEYKRLSIEYTKICQLLNEKKNKKDNFDPYETKQMLKELNQWKNKCHELDNELLELQLILQKLNQDFQKVKEERDSLLKQKSPQRQGVCQQCQKLNEQLKEITNEKIQLEKLFDIRLQFSGNQKNEIQQLKRRCMELESCLMECENKLRVSNKSISKEQQEELNRIQFAPEKYEQQITMLKRKCLVLETKLQQSQISSKITPLSPVVSDRQIKNSFQSTHPGDSQKIVNGIQLSKEELSSLKQQILDKQRLIEELKTKVYLLEAQLSNKF